MHSFTMSEFSPASWVIRQFGSVKALSEVIGRERASIYKWLKPKSLQGTDGRVPGNLHSLILEKAKELELDITAEDLINGR